MELSIKSGKNDFGFLIENNDAWLSSRKIADIFEKDHSKVIRSIEHILENKDDFNEANFGLVEYKDKKGEMRKEYKLNRKSFTLVVMGFTGEKAMAFKKQYIEAFEAMNTTIQTRALSKNGYTMMTDAIKNTCLDIICGDPYIYATEANIINKIVLGMSAKKFRELNNVSDDELTRDFVVKKRLDMLDKCQQLNASLIYSRLSQNDRISIIQKYFDNTYIKE